MREILRLSITLTVVSIISAALLTGIHGVTGPVILERQQKEYRQALEDFFPAIADFQSERVDGDQFDLIMDQDDNLIGIMATVAARGYDGDIVYNLALDGEGTIIGMRIVSHSETPGLGDVITTDNFKEQFTGKGVDDPLEAGIDVDTVSGATISTAAMIVSVRQTVQKIGETYLGRESSNPDLSTIPDGVYRGSVDGTNGILTLEVEIVSGTIENIVIIEQNETDTYFIEAYPLIPERILEEQSLNVDTRTGATMSAERIVRAVKTALADAAGN